MSSIARTPSPRPARAPLIRAARQAAGALAVAALGLGLACARRAHETNPIEAPATAESATSPAGSAAPSDYSLYDLDAAWRDQTGAARTLSSLRGRPVALAMFYARCTASCPLTVVEMKQLEASTDSGVALVLVSLDPTHDDPAALARYARDHALDPARWTLLSGSDDAVRDLAAALDVRYRVLSTDAIAHSNLVTLLDARGVPVARASGLRGVEDLAAAALHSRIASR